MANLQFEDFCQKVCQMLRWKAARGPVSAELTAHLEDHAAALEARGLSPEEAAAQAVTAMGNPYALGHALDQTHPPTLPRGISPLSGRRTAGPVSGYSFGTQSGQRPLRPGRGWFPSRRNCPMTRGTPWY